MCARIFREQNIPSDDALDACVTQAGSNGLARFAETNERDAWCVAADHECSRSRIRKTGHRRRSPGVKRFYPLQPPGLSLLALCFGPADRLPVRCQDKARASTGHLDSVATWLIHIEEKGLLDRMFVRSSLDVDAIFQKDVCGAQYILACIERESHVVQASFRAGVIARIRKIIALVSRGHPHAGLGAIVKHNLLGKHEAEKVLEELAVGLNVNSKAIEVIDPPHIDSARGKSLCLIFECRFEVGRCLIPFGFIIDLEFVTIRIFEHKRLAMAEVSVTPTDVEARAFQCGGAAFQGLW